MEDSPLGVNLSRAGDLPEGFTGYDVAALTPLQQGALDDLKLSVSREDHIYLAHHPELRALVSLFVREVVRTRPRDVLEAAGQFFSSERHLTQLVRSFLGYGTGPPPPAPPPHRAPAARRHSLPTRHQGVRSTQHQEVCFREAATGLSAEQMKATALMMDMQGRKSLRATANWGRPSIFDIFEEPKHVPFHSKHHEHEEKKTIGI